MSKEYTKEECLNMFVDHCSDMVEYWDSIDKTSKQKLEGLLFSVFVALDGGTLSLPAFDLIPSPHQTDKDFHKDNGEDYWPAPNGKEEKVINKLSINQCQIHELYCSRHPRK